MQSCRFLRVNLCIEQELDSVDAYANELSCLVT